MRTPTGPESARTRFTAAVASAGRLTSATRLNAGDPGIGKLARQCLNEIGPPRDQADSETFACESPRERRTEPQDRRR